MRKIKYLFTDVQFSKEILFASHPTRACDKSHRAGIGFIDIGGMVSGQVSLHSIAERAFISDCAANDTSVAQLASGISGNDFGGHKRSRNTTS
jgi:hypothetical protein